MPTVRPVPESDLDRYRRLIEYAFYPEDGPAPDEDVPDRIADRYGVYGEGDDLLATGALYELDARLRGEWTTLGGIAAVSTPPEHRRSGHVRHLCRALLEECRDRDMALTALWPFSTPFYRQFGWALANKYTVYEAPPEQLAAAGTTERGYFEPVGPDDWERLERAQLTHGKGTTLSLRRSEAWWRRRTFDHHDETPWGYAWIRDSEIQGYVLFTFESGEEGRTITVRDFSAADHEARRHLLGLLGTHDSQAETVRLTLAEETRLLDAVADPGVVECTIKTGPMVRICDVERALERCPYPEDASGKLVLSVTDPLVDANDGRVELSISDGRGTCQSTSEDPAVIVDVGTLSQVLIGYRDIEDARTHGLDCDDGTAARLSEWFPPENVCLREFF